MCAAHPWVPPNFPWHSLYGGKHTLAERCAVFKAAVSKASQQQLNLVVKKCATMKSADPELYALMVQGAIREEQSHVAAAATAAAAASAAAAAEAPTAAAAAAPGVQAPVEGEADTDALEISGMLWNCKSS